MGNDRLAPDTWRASSVHAIVRIAMVRVRFSSMSHVCVGQTCKRFGHHAVHHPHRAE
jgi:hypothetical protein